MFSLTKLRCVTNITSYVYLGRSFSSATSNSTNKSSTDTEKKISEILQKRFTDAKVIKVDDVSGGCGAMFNITIVSPEFKSVSLVKQHRMVTEALKNEIKQMHGLRILTSHETES